MYNCSLCGKSFEKTELVIKHIIGECQIPEDSLNYWRNIIKIALEITIKNVYENNLPPLINLTIEEVRSIFILRSLNLVKFEGLPEPNIMSSMFAESAPDALIAIMEYAKLIKENPDGTFSSVDETKKRTK